MQTSTKDSSDPKIYLLQTKIPYPPKKRNYIYPKAGVELTKQLVCRRQLKYFDYLASLICDQDPGQQRQKTNVRRSDIMK